MIDKIKFATVKKVITYNLQGKKNGWLMELFKDQQTNTKTEVYLSATLAGAFKGFHLHRVRAARYICLKGTMKIIAYQYINRHWQKSEYILESGKAARLFIPKNIATGLENIGDEEAWLVNYPDPAYDPALKDEQVEYTEEELKNGIIK